MATTEPNLEMLWLPGPEPLCYACEHGLSGQTKTCYACANGLTGDPRDDGLGHLDLGEDPDFDDDDNIWECWCDVWECRCDSVSRTAELAWCPVCCARFPGSRYLAEVFADDERACWLANLVTHYRHHHRAWDRQHRWIEGHCRPGTYEEEKAKVNEQIKRALIRKHADYLRARGVGPQHFEALAGTTDETMDLAREQLAAV